MTMANPLRQLVLRFGGGGAPAKPGVLQMGLSEHVRGVFPRVGSPCFTCGQLSRHLVVLKPSPGSLRRLFSQAAAQLAHKLCVNLERVSLDCGSHQHQPRLEDGYPKPSLTHVTLFRSHSAGAMLFPAVRLPRRDGEADDTIHRVSPVLTVWASTQLWECWSILPFSTVPTTAALHVISPDGPASIASALACRMQLFCSALQQSTASHATLRIVRAIMNATVWFRDGSRAIKQDSR